jgi:16S rRNA processing protein RimM
LSGQAHRWVALARVLRPRGNKGEVAAELLTDFPERIAAMKEVFLGHSAGKAEPRLAGLKAFWMDRNHPGQGVFHFEGCASISEAEVLRGLDVLIPVEQRVTLPAGKYFVADLVGCSVFETAPERPVVSSPPCSLASVPALVGTVSDVHMTGEDVPGTALLVVDTPGGELLIPLAADICTRIDPAAGRIDVILPEGLRDLNSGA